jgi:uncharacterized membrane protein YcaP (DUF421 family)
LTELAAVAGVSAGGVAAHALKTLVLVVVLIVGLRLLGKREVAQLNVYDLAMLMAVSNAVQNAMTGGLGNLPIGLATSSTIVVAAWALTKVVVREPAVERRVIGTPTVLVSDGNVLRDRLRRERVTDAELEAAFRQHGVAGASDVALAVLEVDGTISVCPGTRSAARGGEGPLRPARRRRRSRARRRG